MKRRDKSEPVEPLAEQAAGQQDSDEVSTKDPAGRPETAAETIPAASDDQQAAVQEDAVQTLHEALVAKEKEIAVLSDKYLRLMAEYDNFRKRSQKEKEAIYGDSVALVVREWLPVIDNLDRAEWAAEQYENDEIRRIAEGIVMIRKQVQDVLDKLGIEAIDCCGQIFDPNLHDAVMHVEDETAGTSTVVEELRKGYKRADRVIRHSVVKVAN
ncbi:MAG: nucleotide exchange factor GrpE [Bacillota bacterium]|nr:nucleotide exchange factor GrpE [Bacillota bacterium]